jgi:hypothetical protein
MPDRTSACRVLVEKHEKKETTWKMHSRRIILEQTLSIIGGHGLDYRGDAGCFEHVNEYSSFIKCWD